MHSNPNQFVRERRERSSALSPTRCLTRARVEDNGLHFELPIGYPKTRIHEVGQRACARLIDGGRARASALAYENNGFRIAAGHG